MNFGDNFPTEYFKGDVLSKSAFISTNVTAECVSQCRDELFKLVDNCEISDFSKGFIKKCYFQLNGSFFVLPTSTRGKYHGGAFSPENSVGGIVNHYKRVLVVSSRVIDRYKEVINREGLTSYNNYVEVLRVACLLHDLGRLGVSGSDLYSSSDHGFIGAGIVASCFNNGGSSFSDLCPFDFYVFPLVYAVENHMFLWKFTNVWDQVLNPNESFVNLTVGLMLSESDFFSTVY